MIPLAIPSAYDAARRHAAVVDRSDRGRIVVSGRDRRSYLHGLLTNDITVLNAGEGCYAAYLTAQGRMITDLYVYELGDVVLISVGKAQKDALLAKLDQFVFSEDVQLGDVTETFVSVALVGPESARMAAGVLDGVTEAELSALPDNGNRRAQVGGQPAIVLRITDAGEPGYELLVAPSVRDGLVASLHAAGAQDTNAALAEAIRVEAGVPKFAIDMDEETIPLEAGIESRAISLTKGCYVGQEVIIRILHRGHGRVAKKLVGLTLDGESAPPRGSVVSVEEKEVGRVTSSALSPSIGRPIALAYVHRDFLEPGTRVAVAGVSAVVSPLPFVRTAAAAIDRK